MLESDSFSHEILAGERLSAARSSTIFDIGRFFWTINKCFIILFSTTGMPHPKELSSDVMPHQKESSMLKVNLLEMEKSQILKIKHNFTELYIF